MDVYETIKNIRSSCDNYADPDLVSTIIYDNYLIGKNNLLKIEGYGILENENYEDRFMKILKEENIFITFGMLNFIPMLNECDIYSFEDETFKITQEDFNENAQEKEVFFGILVEKDSSNYKIGLIDLCSCKVGSCFRPIKNSESEFYKKIDEIINKRIIS
ncbi:MAG: hypothetical protein K6A34_04145 [Methanobrevibacter sp.]|nr:hypothetical protein [Methanobrevibacter sp.]